MYGVGSTKDKATDMSAMIKHYIDRSHLKIIGTTTDAEYQEFFSHDALKRRFEKIVVKEPDEEVLETIIGKVIDDYCKRSNLSFEDETDKQVIINAIMNATASSHRVYNDKVNNPDLSISIIDKAFAFAKFYDSKHITKEHFIDSFSYCDRIYESSQERAISMLKSKKKKEDTEPKTAKIIEVDFINKTRKK
jgi:ATP-dependent Clp protease ATP-binding subunit ClpA